VEVKFKNSELDILILRCPYIIPKEDITYLLTDEFKAQENN
jgi:hypothetical protein